MARIEEEHKWYVIGEDHPEASITGKIWVASIGDPEDYPSSCFNIRIEGSTFEEATELVDYFVKDFYPECQLYSLAPEYEIGG